MPQNSINNNKQIAPDSPIPAKNQETAEIKKQEIAEKPPATNNKTKETQQPIDQSRETLAKTDTANSVLTPAPAAKQGEQAKQDVRDITVEAKPLQSEPAADSQIKTAQTKEESNSTVAPDKAPVQEKIPAGQTAPEEKPQQIEPADEFEPPVAKIKKELPVKTKPKQPTTTSPPLNRPAVQAKSFMAQFLNKLTELRKQANIKRREKMQDNLDKIIIFAKKHNRIDNKDARELTGLSDSRVRLYFNKLEKQGKFVQFGKKGPRVFYKPIAKL